MAACGALRRVLCAAALAALPLVGSAQITSESLLREMVDLSLLARRPTPAYTEAQSSSYDREGQAPGWFANKDAGNFLRDETRDGRTEHVMADLTGPGAVVRVWSANPAGVMRLYFDGEETPRIVAPAADLLTGKVTPFAEPFAYMAGEGCNFYFPLPYAKSLKVTVDNSGGDAAKGLYYHVDFRTYPAGTPLETYTAGGAKPDVLQSVAQALNDPAKRPLPKKLSRSRSSADVSDGKAATLRLAGSNEAIYELKIKVDLPRIPKDAPWADPRQPHNVLRQLILEGSFDNQKTIRAPLGGFFATGPSLVRYDSYPMSVTRDGAMVCRFVMPYKERAEITVRSLLKSRVRVSLEARTGKYDQPDPYYLFAQWRAERQATRPFRDMPLLNTNGEGLWLGANLQVANPTIAWWGEGDEKVLVDGESFPSTFGTGTEDYFGYAWCSGEVFNRPFHGQSFCSKPANFGYDTVYRWHVLDPIPFRKSLVFNMEAWHWDEKAIPTYASTSYWYGTAGNTQPAEIDAALLLIPETVDPEYKLVIEAEDLKSETSGGQITKRTHMWSNSGHEMVLWRDGKPGDKATLFIEVPEKGDYRLNLRLGKAPSCGVHELLLDGQTLGSLDFYGDRIQWADALFGPFQLDKGKHRLEVRAVSKNEKALAYLFAIDYLQLVPVKQEKR